MAAYQTIVVGTDGSETSFGAVDRAGALAADADATLVVVTAYRAEQPDARHSDALGREAYQLVGSAPAEDVVRRARDRAVAAGAGKVETLAVQGRPAAVLREVAAQYGADLLVVGNVGLNTLAGRILGSVPAEVARRSGVDVLIVHTAR